MRKSTRPETTGADSDSGPTSYTYYNKTFEDITDLFLFACTHGDYMLVSRLLQAGDVKADVSNRMGKTALQLSIENEHFEVVKVLLDTIPYEQFRDALLLAIYLGHTNISDYILKHHTYRTFSGGFLDPTNPQAYDDSQFSSDITPLILAAQYNRLAIVHQLLLRGERIDKPHPNMCPCKPCVASSTSDSFRHAQVRLSGYKGICSEVYIALSHADPILHAFELSYELRVLAKDEHYFCQDYKKLANQLSIFAARLLDNVRGQKELDIVLNKTGLPHEEKYENLARFDLAIQHREKPFVSHSNCQQKLMEKWYNDLSVIQNAHVMKRAMFYVAYIICFPFVSLIYLFSPTSKIGSMCQQPNLKFKAYIASYFTFLGLIIGSSFFSAAHLEKVESLSTYDATMYANYIRWIYPNTDVRHSLVQPSTIGTERSNDTLVNCDIRLRFMEPNPFEWAIFVWVMGFVWNEFKQVVSVGVRLYLKVPSNYVDCSMNLLYLLYFVFLFASMILTRTSLSTFGSATYWDRMANYDRLSESEQQYYLAKTRRTLYWLNADRFYWENGDLHNLAEAFFAMGNVMSICRICFLLPIIAFVGPLQVMLERMIIDISKWIAIIVIFFVAFTCSLFLIYSHFATALENRNVFDPPPISIPDAVADQSRCPDSFLTLINQTSRFIIDQTPTTSNTSDSQSFCEKASGYKQSKQIGSYPGLHYFGNSIKTTVLTIFFTLFGVIGSNGRPDRGYELLTGSCYKPADDTYAPNFDEFLSNLGFVIYGMFSFVCVTVLVNTLIAMLEQSIEKIDDRADMEWKFARSKLYIEYVRDGNSLPVPLNILPSPKSVMSTVRKVKEWISSKKDARPAVKNRQEPAGHHHVANTNGVHHDRSRNEKMFNRAAAHDSNEKLTYKIVIERVVKRFLLYYQSNHSGLDEIKDGFEFKEIKNDISSFRFELSHELDVLEDMQTSLTRSMESFNGDLQSHFDLTKIKSQFKHRDIS